MSLLDNVFLPILAQIKEKKLTSSSNMELESPTTCPITRSETQEIAQELRGKDSDDVAVFLNWKLSQLEALRREEEAKSIGPNESGWGVLPDLILEKVFSYLSIQQRYYASCTCLQWYLAFHLKKPWAEFHMTDATLCRRKFDYGDRSWRYILDHHRAQQLISHVGPYLRRLSLTPKSFPGLFAHYHFMNHVSAYAERYATDPDSPQACQFNLQHFRFSFFCDIPNRAEHFIMGTGGDILGSLKRVISNLHDLRRLDLIDLLLVPEDAIHLLDGACSVLCTKLAVLSLVNATKDHFTLLHPACFLHLRRLYISPQNLGEEVVEMLANLRNLAELHIVQNSYTGFAVGVPAKSWFRVNHLFQVYLRTATKVDKEVVWQERAPVVSVLYDCPVTKFSETSVLTVIDLYSESLREYGHFGLPKFGSSRKFGNRIDAPLLTLCRKCPYLSSLYIRDRISTSTALLIVSMSPNLRDFVVRRNALIKKIDFDRHPNLYLDKNFSTWITLNAKSYERTSREIGQVLGKLGWRPVTDKDFKVICAQRAPY